jgi:competence protein ComGC
MTTTSTLPPFDPGQLPKRCGLAITSLVLGIVSYVLCLGPLTGIPGAICGHVAQTRIRKSGKALTGDGLALAGIIMGWTSLILVPIIGLLAAIAIPNFVRARTEAQRSACIMNLRMIEGAKAAWALENKKENGDIPRDEDLWGAGKYMKEKPTCPAGGQYSLQSVERPPTCTISRHEIGTAGTSRPRPANPPNRSRPR